MEEFDIDKLLLDDMMDYSDSEVLSESKKNDMFLRCNSDWILFQMYEVLAENFKEQNYESAEHNRLIIIEYIRNGRLKEQGYYILPMTSDKSKIWDLIDVIDKYNGEFQELADTLSVTLKGYYTKADLIAIVKFMDWDVIGEEKFNVLNEIFGKQIDNVFFEMCEDSEDSDSDEIEPKTEEI